jgi:hypothetical protein
MGGRRWVGWVIGGRLVDCEGKDGNGLDDDTEDLPVFAVQAEGLLRGEEECDEDTVKSSDAVLFVFWKRVWTRRLGDVEEDCDELVICVSCVKLLLDVLWLWSMEKQTRRVGEPGSSPCKAEDDSPGDEAFFPWRRWCLVRPSADRNGLWLPVVDLDICRLLELKEVLCCREEEDGAALLVVLLVLLADVFSDLESVDDLERFVDRECSSSEDSSKSKISMDILCKRDALKCSLTQLTHCLVAGNVSCVLCSIALIAVNALILFVFFQYTSQQEEIWGLVT